MATWSTRAANAGVGQPTSGKLTEGQQADAETRLRQAVQTDPRLSALYRSYQDARASGDPRMAQASLRTLNDALNERQHAAYALPHDYVLKDPDALTIERLGWWGRNADWAVPVMIGAGAVAAPLAAGAVGSGAGAPAAGGTGAAGLANPTVGGLIPGAVATPLEAFPGAAAAGGAAAAPAAAGGGGLGGFLSSPLGIASLIGTGGNVLSSVIGARAAGKASKQQQEAIDKALAAQGPLYDRALSIAEQQHTQGRADLQPYATAGNQGVTALTSLLGLPAAAAPAAPRLTTPGGPALQPLSSVAGGGMVQLRAPNGQTKTVPADQAAYFVARGATRV